MLSAQGKPPLKEKKHQHERGEQWAGNRIKK
jgi:hypothetical protein